MVNLARVADDPMAQPIEKATKCAATKVLVDHALKQRANLNKLINLFSFPIITSLKCRDVGKVRVCDPFRTPKDAFSNVS